MPVIIRHENGISCILFQKEDSPRRDITRAVEYNCTTWSKRCKSLKFEFSRIWTADRELFEMHHLFIHFQRSKMRSHTHTHTHTHTHARIHTHLPTYHTKRAKLAKQTKTDECNWKEWRRWIYLIKWSAASDWIWSRRWIPLQFWQLAFSIQRGRERVLPIHLCGPLL